MAVLHEPGAGAEADEGADGVEDVEEEEDEDDEGDGLEVVGEEGGQALGEDFAGGGGDVGEFGVGGILDEFEGPVGTEVLGGEVAGEGGEYHADEDGGAEPEGEEDADDEESEDGEEGNGVYEFSEGDVGGG